MFKDFAKTYFTIQNERINALEGEIDQDHLVFYTENPRIYSIVCAASETPTQGKIFEILSQMEHVKKLYQSIKRNGGLTDPVIVRKNSSNDALEVLEGNSRLAAYRMLAKNDPLRWKKILVRVLPEDINDSHVFTLLGEYHVTGRKDWAPFEVAGYVYRRHVRHNVAIEEVARELSMTKNSVGHLISVVQFMTKYQEENPNRWSYYDEYLKSRKIEKARKNHPELDQVVVKQIQDGKIAKATDVRDILPVVVSGNDKNLKKFISGERSLAQAYESAQAQGADTAFYNKLKKARDDFAKTSIDEELAGMNHEILNKCKFELCKLSVRFGQLIKKIEKII